MITIFEFQCSKRTELTSDLRMFLLLMVLLVCLSDAGSTFLTFVVLPRAADVVHSEFGHFDMLITDAAKF
jgi:hypothetical protein